MWLVPRATQVCKSTLVPKMHSRRDCVTLPLGMLPVMTHWRISLGNAVPPSLTWTNNEALKLANLKSFAMSVHRALEQFCPKCDGMEAEVQFTKQQSDTDRMKVHNSAKLGSRFVEAIKCTSCVEGDTCGVEILWSDTFHIRTTPKHCELMFVWSMFDEQPWLLGQDLDVSSTQANH